MAAQKGRTKAGEVERLNRTALLGGVLSPCRIVAVSSKFLTSDYGATLLRRFTGAYYGFCYGACRAKRSVDATACDSLPFSRRNWQQSMDLSFTGSTPGSPEQISETQIGTQRTKIEIEILERKRCAQARLV